MPLWRSKHEHRPARSGAENRVDRLSGTLRRRLSIRSTIKRHSASGRANAYSESPSHVVKAPSTSWPMKRTSHPTLTVDVPQRGATLNKCRFVTSAHKLGSGAYGAVLLGTDLYSSLPVAIKFIPEGRMRPASLEREVQILHRLSGANHPALVKFHAHLRPAQVEAGEVRANSTLPLAKPLGSYHALVMDVARGGELFDYVVKHDGLREKESAPLCAQLCDAVRAAHALGIAHRDLKLENVLLIGRPGESECRRIKLIDWGLAHQHALAPDGSVVPERLHSRCGSRSYMAPEVSHREACAARGYNGFAADVWSLGVCLFAIHLGFFPFEQANPEHDWRARRVVVAQSEGRSTMETILQFYPARPLRMSVALVALLDRMLIFDPHRRATLTEVLSSEWLAPHVSECCPMSLDLASARDTDTELSRASDSSVSTENGSVTMRPFERQETSTTVTSHTCSSQPSQCSSSVSCSSARMLHPPPSHMPPSHHHAAPGGTAPSRVPPAPSAPRPRVLHPPPSHMPPDYTREPFLYRNQDPSPFAVAAALAARGGSLAPPALPEEPAPTAEEPPTVVVVAGGRPSRGHGQHAQPSWSSRRSSAEEAPPLSKAAMRDGPAAAMGRQSPVGKQQRRSSDEGHPTARDYIADLFAKKCKLARSRSARGTSVNSARESAAASPLSIQIDSSNVVTVTAVPTRV